MKGEFLNEKTKAILWRVALEYRKKRKKALLRNNLECEKFRDELCQIKKKAISQIESLKEKAIFALKENGINVFEVKDAKEAREIIEKILKGKTKIIKSKSNAFNEIEKEGFLADKELIETDLGDFICQIMKEKESHPVLPAIHLTPEEISKKIKEKFNEDIQASPEKIADFIRNLLRKKISEAEAGISGVNVVTADGKILILENEGNISLVSRLPETHIIVSGFEKIVENLDDALKIIKAFRFMFQ